MANKDCQNSRRLLFWPSRYITAVFCFVSSIFCFFLFVVPCGKLSWLLPRSFRLHFVWCCNTLQTLRILSLYRCSFIFILTLLVIFSPRILSVLAIVALPTAIATLFFSLRACERPARRGGISTDDQAAPRVFYNGNSPRTSAVIASCRVQHQQQKQQLLPVHHDRRFRLSPTTTKKSSG